MLDPYGIAVAAPAPLHLHAFLHGKVSDVGGVGAEVASSVVKCPFELGAV